MLELKPKQINFCKEYIITGNAGASYEKAGYKARGKSAKVEACKLLKLPHIKAYLDELRAETKSNDILDIKEVHLFLSNIIKGLELDRFVYIDKKTGESKEIQRTPKMSDKIRASDLLCKSLGGYVQKEVLENERSKVDDLIDALNSQKR